MKSEEIDFISKGGLQIHAKCWLPDQYPQAVICLVHGLGEHIGRYEAMAKYFSKNHIALFAHDQRGHGKSEGKTGHAKYDNLLDDLQELVINARKEYNDLPIFLFGHDMGGNLIANYLLKLVSSEISGAIISGGWFKPAVNPSGMENRKAKFFGTFWPSFTIHNRISPSNLAYDDTISVNYEQDPYVHHKISLQLYNSLKISSKFAMTNAALIEIPILVCHGEGDEITSPEASKKFTAAVGSSATFKLWKNAKHEPHQDTNREQVWSFYCNWIMQQLK